MVPSSIAVNQAAERNPGSLPSGKKIPSDRFSDEGIFSISDYIGRANVAISAASWSSDLQI
jgi:hypothetical protein